MPQPAEQRLTHISPPGIGRLIHTDTGPDERPARREPRMQPNGASDPTTASERMLEIRAPLASCIAEGAIGVHRSSRSNAFWERCAPEVTTLKRCPVHTTPLVKAVTLPLKARCLDLIPPRGCIQACR
jgi:hypothetical protein